MECTVSEQVTPLKVQAVSADEKHEKLRELVESDGWSIIRDPASLDSLPSQEPPSLDDGPAFFLIAFEPPAEDIDSGTLLECEMGKPKSAQATTLRVARDSVGTLRIYIGSSSALIRSTLGQPPRLLGVMIDGADSTAWLDGVEAGFTVPVGLENATPRSIVFGSRSNGDDHWQGSMGHVLAYPGTPTAHVRERMSRIMLSLLHTRTKNVHDNLEAPIGLSVGIDGHVFYEKNADVLVQPYSLTKALVAYIARTHIADEQLDELLRVAEPDECSSGTDAPNLQIGDEVSVRDLLYLICLPSHNGAARMIARLVGRQLPGGGGSPLVTFTKEMNRIVGQWGWAGATFAEPTGLLPGSLATARQLSQLLFRIYAEDQWLFDVLGTRTRQFEILGPNPRSREVQHRINLSPIPFPEVLAGKTGSVGGKGHLMVMTGDSPSTLRASIAMEASPGTLRYPAVRKLVDHWHSRGRDGEVDRVDLAVSQNLSWHNSLTSLALNERFFVREELPRRLRIGRRFKGIQVPHPTNGIQLLRWGRVVQLVFAGVRLPADFSQLGIIPKGYWPSLITFGVLSGEAEPEPHQLVRVTIRGSRVQLSGNSEKHALRGEVHWLTEEPEPE